MICSKDAPKRLPLSVFIEGRDPGAYHCGEGEGWINVFVTDEGFDVTWSTHKTSNRLGHGRTHIAALDPHGRVKHLSRSHITMWPCRLEEDKVQATCFLERKAFMAWRASA